MTRQEILDEIEGAMGFVPDWMNEMPDDVLEQYWTTEKWVGSDTKISARDKMLIGYGAAAAIHCPY